MNHLIYLHSWTYNYEKFFSFLVNFVCVLRRENSFLTAKIRSTCNIRNHKKKTVFINNRQIERTVFFFFLGLIGFLFAHVFFSYLFFNILIQAFIVKSFRFSFFKFFLSERLRVLYNGHQSSSSIYRAFQLKNGR